VAKLVPVTGGYAIDATEVTRSQYEAWLATNPPASGQPAYCSWNADLAPVSFCMAQKSVCKTDCASHPQVCVDWCDAYAYCKAVGKRSCGGRSGGATAYLDYEVAAASQWQNACSSGGVHNYPYGGAVGAGAMDGFEPKACNGFEKGVFTTMPVGSLGACQSSEPGYGWVFDLSGNALEWEDSCKTSVGDGDRCRLRGGYFGYAGAGLRCGKDMYKYRGDADETTGIRCCSP
jgi:formylglycine-generating enzyme required for sulfatase activity